MKQKKQNINISAIKFARRISREEEIQTHGKLLVRTHIQKSKKIYDRKKLKKLFGA